MPSTIIYSSSSPPLHAWTRLFVVYVTVCRHLWKSSITRVVAQRNTHQSEHASESKIAFEVQHRKHPNMASQVLFQETCYLLLPLVPRTLPPLPLTLTLFFLFFIFNFFALSSLEALPTYVQQHWDCCPKQEALRVLCHHTLLVLTLVITLWVPTFSEQ